MKAIYKTQRLYLKHILALLCLSAVYTADCQGLYDYTFRNIDSKDVRLQDFAGKKILFIILSVNAADSLATQLKSFVAAYGEKVQVIGVLSQEDGYSKDWKAEVNFIYQNTGVLVTDVMGTGKGNGQPPVMKWLTNKKENGHFDIDSKGPGQKFFVNESGKLYAVLGAKLSLSSPFVNKVANATEADQQAVSVKGKTRP